MSEPIALADCPRCRGQGRLFAYVEDDSGATYLHCEECERGYRDPQRLAAADGFLTLDSPGTAHPATLDDVIRSPWRVLLARAAHTRQAIADWVATGVVAERASEPWTLALDSLVGEPVSVEEAALLFDDLISILCELEVEGFVTVLSTPAQSVRELDWRGLTWLSARLHPELLGVPDFALVAGDSLLVEENLEEYRRPIDVPPEVRTRSGVSVCAYYRCYGLDPVWNDEFHRALYVEARFSPRKNEG